MSIKVSDLDIDGVEPPKPAKPPPRFFLAHAKSCDDPQLERLVSWASVLLDHFAKGQPYNLVLGRAYFAARFRECGSWDAWCAEIATGVDYLTRRPIFDAIFIPVGAIGTGTARIAQLAIEVKRPVFAFKDQGLWARVVGVRQVSKSWQDGWRMQVDRAL